MKLHLYPLVLFSSLTLAFAGCALSPLEDLPIGDNGSDGPGRPGPPGFGAGGTSSSDGWGTGGQGGEGPLMGGQGGEGGEGPLMGGQGGQAARGENDMPSGSDGPDDAAQEQP